MFSCRKSENQADAGEYHDDSRRIRKDLKLVRREYFRMVFDFNFFESHNQLDQVVRRLSFCCNRHSTRNHFTKVCMGYQLKENLWDVDCPEAETWITELLGYWCTRCKRLEQMSFNNSKLAKTCISCGVIVAKTSCSMSPIDLEFKFEVEGDRERFIYFASEDQTSEVSVDSQEDLSDDLWDSEEDQTAATEDDLSGSEEGPTIDVNERSEERIELGLRDLVYDQTLTSLRWMFEADSCSEWSDSDSENYLSDDESDESFRQTLASMRWILESDEDQEDARASSIYLTDADDESEGSRLHQIDI